MSDDTQTPRRRMTVADYDATQRTRAAANGRPILRMSSPALPYSQAIDPTGSSAVFFWIKDGKLVYAGVDDASARPATAQVIAEVFDAPGQQLVAVDRQAEKRIMRVVDQGAGSRNAGATKLISVPDEVDSSGVATVPLNRIADLARQLKFTMTLPVSSKFCTLTTVLTRKFWLPAGKSTAQVADWREAFGLDASFRSLREMLGMSMAYAHTKINVAQGNDLIVSFLKSEVSAVNSVAYRGVAAASSAYMATERLSESWNSVERTDPILRHRAVIDGSVARMSTLVKIDGAVHGVVSQPFKLREGEVIVMADDTSDARVQNARLVGTTCDEELMGALRPSKVYESAGQFAFLDAAVAAHESVLITTKPFGGGGRVGQAKRWSSQMGNGYDKPDVNGDRPPLNIVRDVPLDIWLAGTPKE